jgi:Flp pilus assembly protein TadG
MVHMSYVPPIRAGPESTRKSRSDVPAEKWLEIGAPPEIRGKGSALGPRTWRPPTRLGRRDERGAEMVEFAFVVVLLIALLAAQSTITQAAADGARAGIVSATGAGAATAAQNQASIDIGWMNKGACGPSTTVITCVATPEQCPSSATNTCLSVTVTYNYASSPLFPELPGFGVIMPSSLSSTNVLQLSTPTS